MNASLCICIIRYNYRSAQGIVSVSNVICGARPPLRSDSECRNKRSVELLNLLKKDPMVSAEATGRSDARGHPCTITVTSCGPDSTAELDYVCKQITSVLASGTVRPAEIAVLYRINATGVDLKKYMKTHLKTIRVDMQRPVDGEHIHIILVFHIIVFC